jgi:hypothetical protein
MTTKILALTDALGNLVRFVLLPGHRFDTVGVPPLLDGVSFEALIADKAFDSDAIIADLNAAPRSLFPSIRAGPSRFRSTRRYINGVISSRISSVNSKNSNASPCAPTKPTQAILPSSISQQPS